MMFRGEKRCAAAAGSVLIFTLWVLVCLTVISLGFAHRVRLEAKATAYTVANIRSFYKAESALYEKAIELIEYGQEGEAEPEPEDGGEEEEEEDVVRCEVIPEEGKLNVNLAPQQLIENLKPVRGSLAREIIRRRLGDDLIGHTEDDAPFRLPEELLILDEMKPEMWYGEEEGETGIRDLLTVYGDGRIDINAAPAEVIEAIPGLDRRLAEKVVALRAGPDGVLGTDDDTKWKSFEGMRASLKVSADKLSPFNKYCKLGSEYYTIRVAASKSGSRATARIAAVVRITRDRFDVVSWRED
jgi:type II secretory pathway component PulK